MNSGGDAERGQVDEKFGPWKAIRDIGVAGINRGQGPLVLFLILLIIMALKMPRESAGVIAEEFVSWLRDFWMLGWILSVVLVIGWIWHARAARRIFHEELHRVGVEKSRLQESMTTAEGQHKLKSIREEP